MMLAFLLVRVQATGQHECLRVLHAAGTLLAHRVPREAERRHPCVPTSSTTLVFMACLSYYSRLTDLTSARLETGTPMVCGFGVCGISVSHCLLPS
jgi:hypothetical protein